MPRPPVIEEENPVEGGEINGAPLEWVGRFRIYYNSRAAFPAVWAVDDGEYDSEKNIAYVVCNDVTLSSVFVPKKKYPEPSAYLTGVGRVTIDGLTATIRGE